MLRSVKQLFEYLLGAADGEVGHVNDFYFDDQNWMVRYLVADTGSWMPGRLVLIAPHVFGPPRSASGTPAVDFCVTGNKSNFQMTSKKI